MDFRSNVINGWNVELIQEIFEPVSEMVILSVKWPNMECMDKLIWKEDKLGLFTVGSSYILNCAGGDDRNKYGNIFGGQRYIRNLKKFCGGWQLRSSHLKRFLPGELKV